MRWSTLLFVAVLTMLGCKPAPSANRNASTSAPSLVAPVDDLPLRDDDASVPTTATPSLDPAVAALSAASMDELVGKLAVDKERNAAATALALRGSEALPVLTAALEDTKPEVRAAAAYSLGQMGAKATPAIEALRKRVAEDDHEAVQTAALFAIDAIQGK